MKKADIPDQFPVPFGNAAGGGFIRPIPEASQVGIQDGAASLETGFPPLNFLPVSSGGVPPFGQDMNGLLNQSTSWNQWQGAGAAALYDSAFQTAIGGYPKDAIVTLAGYSQAGVCLISLVDDNMDPITLFSVGANWQAFFLLPQTTIITASGSFTILSLGTNIFGLARVSSPAVSSATLPTPVSTSLGYEVWIEDLVGNFNAFPVTISAPSGMTIAGLATFVCNVNRQCVRFRFFGSNLWSVKA